MNLLGVTLIFCLWWKTWCHCWTCLLLTRRSSSSQKHYFLSWRLSRCRQALALNSIDFQCTEHTTCRHCHQWQMVHKNWEVKRHTVPKRCPWSKCLRLIIGRPPLICIFYSLLRIIILINVIIKITILFTYVFQFWGQEGRYWHLPCFTHWIYVWIYGIMSVNQSWHNLWRHSSSHALTTATQSSPVYLHADWCHCNECKTLPLDWCWIWIDERTSVLHYNSCTGFRSCIASHSR